MLNIKSTADLKDETNIEVEINGKNISTYEIIELILNAYNLLIKNNGKEESEAIMMEIIKELDEEG